MTKQRSIIYDTLTDMGKRSVIIPAVVFAAVAIISGLIISNILSFLFAEQTKEFINGVVRHIGDGYRYINGRKIGKWFRRSELSELSYGPGGVTIWLISCMGGMTGYINGVGDDLAESVNAEFALTLGVGALYIIPVVSFLIAYAVRKLVIKKMQPDKELQYSDGLLAAVLFTAVNLILTLIPRSLEAVFTQGFEAMGDFVDMKVAIGSDISSLILFSFTAAFLFSAPWKTLKNTTAVRYMKAMLTAGFIAAVTVSVFTVLNTASSGSNGNTAINTALLPAAFLLAPNIIIWVTPFFTGGSFQLSSNGFSFVKRFTNINELYIGLFGEERGVEMSVEDPLSRFRGFSAGTFGAVMEDSYSDTVFRWIGIPLIIAGLFIAIAVLYKTLRYNNSFASAAVKTVCPAAGAVWIMVRLAQVNINMRYDLGYGDEIYFASLKSASLINLFLYVCVLSVAALIVWTARKSAVVDNILRKIANIPTALAITTIATIIACLTVTAA